MQDLLNEDRLELVATGTWPAGQWSVFDGTHPVTVDRAAIAERLSVQWNDGTVNSTAAIIPRLETRTDYSSLITVGAEGRGAAMIRCSIQVRRGEFKFAGSNDLIVRAFHSDRTMDHLLVVPLPPSEDSFSFQLFDDTDTLITSGSARYGDGPQ